MILSYQVKKGSGANKFITNVHCGGAFFLEGGL
jgi:hypothetical protein